MATNARVKRQGMVISRDTPRQLTLWLKGRGRVVLEKLPPGQNSFQSGAWVEFDESAAGAGMPMQRLSDYNLPTASVATKGENIGEISMRVNFVLLDAHLSPKEVDGRDYVMAYVKELGLVPIAFDAHLKLNQFYIGIALIPPRRSSSLGSSSLPRLERVYKTPWHIAVPELGAFAESQPKYALGAFDSHTGLVVHADQERFFVYCWALAENRTVSIKRCGVVEEAGIGLGDWIKFIAIDPLCTKSPSILLPTKAATAGLPQVTVNDDDGGDCGIELLHTFTLPARPQPLVVYHVDDVVGRVSDADLKLITGTDMGKPCSVRMQCRLDLGITQGSVELCIVEVKRGREKRTTPRKNPAGSPQSAIAIEQNGRSAESPTHGEELPVPVETDTPAHPNEIGDDDENDDKEWDNYSVADSLLMPDPMKPERDRPVYGIVIEVTRDGVTHCYVPEQAQLLRLTREEIHPLTRRIVAGCIIEIPTKQRLWIGQLSDKDRPKQFHFIRDHVFCETRYAPLLEIRVAMRVEVDDDVEKLTLGGGGKLVNPTLGMGGDGGVVEDPDGWVHYKLPECTGRQLKAWCRPSVRSVRLNEFSLETKKVVHWEVAQNDPEVEWLTEPLKYLSPFNIYPQHDEMLPECREQKKKSKADKPADMRQAASNGPESTELWAAISEKRALDSQHQLQAEDSSLPSPPPSGRGGNSDDRLNLDDDDEEEEEEETGLETASPARTLHRESIERAAISPALPDDIDEPLEVEVLKFSKIGVCVSETPNGLYVFCDKLPAGTEAFLPWAVVWPKEPELRARHGSWIQFNDTGGRRPRVTDYCTNVPRHLTWDTMPLGTKSIELKVTITVPFQYHPRDNPRVSAHSIGMIDDEEGRFEEKRGHKFMAIIRRRMADIDNDKGSWVIRKMVDFDMNVLETN